MPALISTTHVNTKEAKLTTTLRTYRPVEVENVFEGCFKNAWPTFGARGKSEIRSSPLKKK